MTQSRKRILVVTHAGGSPVHGPNTRWYYLGQALKAHGVDVEIVSSGFFHKYIHQPVVASRYQTDDIDGLTYHWIRTRSYRTRGLSQVVNQLEFTALCRVRARALARRRPDLVVASSPHPLVNFPAAAIARRSRSRFWIEVRDLWPQVLREIGGYPAWHPYMALLGQAERFGVRRAERIVSVKPGDVEYFQERYGIEASRFAYVPNGFLPSDGAGSMPEAVRALRERYRFVVGYAGALSAYYGLEDLLALAQRLKAVEGLGFLVVGKGDLGEQLHARAVAAGLDHVHFLGPVPKQDVPSVLDAFDVCYVGLRDLPVHRYGISCNKLYEYMHAGKPILGSYTAGYDPVAAADCGFTARPGDYDSLAHALRTLISDEDLRVRLGHNARHYFDTHHDFRVVAGRLLETLGWAE